MTVLMFLRKPTSLMCQTLLVVFVWASFCFQTSVSVGGCGVLATIRSLAVSSHLFPQVQSVSINCTDKLNGEEQTLWIVLDSSSLLTGNRLANETLVDLYLHTTFNNPVMIRPIDSTVKVLTLNSTDPDKVHKDHILRKHLSGEKETFGIIVAGNRGSFYVSNASLEIRPQRIDDSNSPGLCVCEDKDSSDMPYIVGLAVTSTIAIVSLVFCIVLYVKLRSQASRTHHYVEPLPTDKTFRPPAQIPPFRSASESELIGAKSPGSFTYDYAFVDGPRPLQTATQPLNSQSDSNFENGIVLKWPLQKTRSSSAPSLHPGESLYKCNTIKPKPPPKPSHTAMRKVSSADQVDDCGYMDASTFSKPKPIPSPRPKRKMIANKNNTTRSTTSDGYLRPVESFLTKKSTENSANINRTMDSKERSNREASPYVPMEIEHSSDVEHYVPMGSPEPRSSSEQPGSTAAGEQVTA